MPEDDAEVYFLAATLQDARHSVADRAALRARSILLYVLVNLVSSGHARLVTPLDGLQ